MTGDDNALVKKESSLATADRVVPSWNEIGESFETLGKVGLAMAIGFSAAGLFCRLAEQGKVRVPSFSGLVLNHRIGQPIQTKSTPRSPDQA